MLEKLRKKDRRKSPIFVAATLGLVGLFGAGCAIDQDANTVTINNCSGETYYTQQGSNVPVNSSEALIKTAEKEVEQLRKQVALAGGPVNFADPNALNDNSAGSNVDTLLASTDELTISYPSDASLADSDSVYYHFTHGKSNSISRGALECISGVNIYPTTAFTSLKRFIEETKGLN
jgi:hypothetical protein